MRQETGLVMRIPVTARLRTTIPSLKRALSDHPGLSLLSEGTELSYLAKRGSDGEFYTFRFGREYVAIETHSGLSPLYLMRESLLSLIGMLAMLGDSYEVKLGSIFPFLIHSLASPELNGLREAAHAIPPGKKSDIMLSKRIIELHSLLSQSQSHAAELDLKVSSLLAHLAVHDSSFGRVSLSRFAGRYGAGPESLKGMESCLSSMGYRLIRHDSDMVSVVRS